MIVSEEQPNTKPEFSEAARFIAALTGQLGETTPVIFQTFTDGPKSKPDPLAHVIPGTLRDCWSRLEWLNEQGAGVFVTVNEMRGARRRTAEFKTARAVFQEDDTGDAPLPPLVPHIVVESSPGKFHRYWLTVTEDRKAWEAVQQTMVDRHGSDPNAKDAARVLRLPGTLHQKNKGKPFRVRILEISGAAPYTWQEIVAAIPPAEKEPETKISEAAGKPHAFNEACMRRILSHIKENSKRDHWLKVVFAIRRAFHAASVLTEEHIYDVLADEWSRDTKNYESFEDVRYKMREADTRDGAGIGFLWNEALKGGMQPDTEMLQRLHNDNPDDDFSVIKTTDLPRKVTADDLHARIEGMELTDETPGAIVRDLATASVTSIEEARLKKALAKAAGVSQKAVERDIAAVRQSGGGTHHDYATAFLTSIKRKYGHPAVGAEGMLYTYIDGVWTGCEAREYAVEIAEQFSGLERCERRSDYTSIAQHAYDIAHDGSFFSDAPAGVACPGGFVRLVDGKATIEKLTAEHRQRFTLSVTPEAGAHPLFDRFLEETFTTERDGEAAEQTAFLQEIMGAALAGLMAQFEKAVLMLGGGRAGKGTVLRIFEQLVPEPYRAAVSPFRWTGEYHVAHLAGKRLNIVGELPDGEPIPAAVFKQVTGRDLLSGRHPTHRPFEFRNEAAHLFNSNAFITTRDRSDAFFSRWLIIDFPNSRLISGAPIDTGLAQRIIAHELPQIVTWALEGAARLQTRGRFIETAAHSRLMQAWRVCTNSVAAFLLDEQVCQLDTTGLLGLWTPRAEFYEHYRSWCFIENRRALGKQKVYELLETGQVPNGLGVSLGQLPARDGGRRVVHGVKSSQPVAEYFE